MTAMPNDEFAEKVLRMAEQAPEAGPTATYDPDGDCIEFLAKPDPFYAERVDDLVTVYYSQETGEVIGSLIKCVSDLKAQLLRDLPGFRIVISQGRVRLEHVFLARLWSEDRQPDALPTVTYQKLAELAEQTDAEAELAPA